ncbi:GapA-binding peptide SR1P [Gracilibacillus sp. YIM 98692]|nr:GapA-binding peptide SR1P [Gracilibacillus sp. YIM 98692]
MGTLVCQNCNSTIDHFEDEKVTVLYAKCRCCRTRKRLNK